MPELRISKEIHEKIQEFKQIVEAVIEEKIGLENCAELILSHGMDTMLAEIIGSVDQPTLLKSFQQLGSKHPAQVYAYVADTLQRGVSVRERALLKRKIGFYQRTRRRRRASSE